MLFYFIAFIVAQYLNLSSRIESLTSKDVDLTESTLIKYGCSNGMILFLMINSIILLFVYNIFWDLLVSLMFLFMCLQAYVNFIVFPIIVEEKEEELTLRISSMIGFLLFVIFYLIV